VFETRTYEYLMKKCLERVPNNVDKREGSIIYDALSASVEEL